jgi:hypothetical protein
MATGTRSPFATDTPDLSGVVPYQGVRTGPDPQGCPQDRCDLAKIITTERRRDQEDDVDRVGGPLFAIRQFDVVVSSA